MHVADSEIRTYLPHRLLVLVLLSSALAAPRARAQPGAPTVGLRTVAEGLTSPVALAAAPDESGRLFIVDQVGQVRIVDAGGTLLAEPFLDVGDRMVTLMDGFDERGLLGLAFHPQYADNGRFFVYYSAPLREGAPAAWNSTSTIAEFRVSADDPNRADPASHRVLLEVDQPQFNHNGGTLAFGPGDGYLYVSLGDGGGANDTGQGGDLVGHVDDWYAANAGGNAQAVEENLLGSILRLDVDAGDPYGVPDDNPFVGRDGLDEIYAYGLRNPYRMAFDPGGEHRLFAGDAGQNGWEEVNVVTRGGNYGWNVKEGTHCFDASNPGEDAATCPDVVGAGHPDEGAPLRDPVIEYLNGNRDGGLGLVVVGGVVYRGDAIAALDGRYLFGDWSTAFSEPAGQVFVATEQEEGLWSYEKVVFSNTPDGELGHFLLALGQDADGGVYVLTTDTAGPTGETGRVYELVPATATANDDAGELPATLVLEQNYPNPFNPATRIAFRVAAAGPVTLTVYDALGRAVATLVDRVVAPGPHGVTWDGTDAAGRPLPSGVYLYRLSAADGASRARVMTLLR